MEMGDADDLTDMAKLVTDEENKIKTIFKEKTGQKESVVDSWMMRGQDKWFTAQEALDAKDRIRLTGEAMQVAMDDVALIPLIQTMSSQAVKRGFAKYNSVPIGWAWAMLADPL